MADITNLTLSANVSTILSLLDTNLTSIRNLCAGSSAPASPVAFQLWLDTSTTPDSLKMRNAANSAWVVILADVTSAGGGLLPLTGGTMSGAIAMGSTKVTGLATGTASGDAVNKGQVDASPKSSSTTLVGFSTTANRPLFVATASLSIVRVYLYSDTATTGSGAGNRYDFQVRNVGTSGAGTTDMLSVAKTTNGAEIGSYAPYNLGADQNLTMAVGEGLQLRVTGTGSPTSLAAANIMAAVHYSVAV